LRIGGTLKGQMARARKEIDDVPPGLAEELERAARQAGALAIGKVKPPRGTLSRRARAELLDALARRGLERTARAVRVPLREQVDALLEPGEPIATAALRKQLKGVTSAAEFKLVLADLLRARRAALVVRGRVEHVARVSDALLSREEVAELAAMTRSLARLATSTRPRSGGPSRTLLAADVLALIDPLRRQLGRAHQEPDAGDPVALLVAAARGQTNPTTGLAFVPEVARALDGRLAGDALRAALVSAAGAGLVELRPESGIELLSPAEAAACPRGPDGSPLSWLRVVAEDGGRP
jgi:hypothetical protein